MFNDNWYENRLKEIAESNRKKQEEIKSNPLSQYSTSQLKSELRRRKNK